MPASCRPRLNTTQQVGGSIGIALLNTVAATATANWIVANGGTTQAEMAQAAVHGFTTAMWISVSAMLGRGRAHRDPGQREAHSRPKHSHPTRRRSGRTCSSARLRHRGEESPAGMHA